jgi:methionyl-tRNA formyltransferase
MNKMSKTIIFFGSGPVAAESLRLLANDFQIEAVVTKPKPAHHKGAFPVLEVAEQLALPIQTVSNKQELSELITTTPFRSSLAVLVDFGIIVGQDVIDSFPQGIVNSHFSLLPQWRGADPITFSILSGQEVTGVSLMLLVARMDEGPLLAQAPLHLATGITTPVLTHDLIEISHAMLKEVLPRYQSGEIIPIPQDPSMPITYSRKLTKDDGLLDWSKPANQLEREVRAFIGWPQSRTTLAGKEVIITKAHTIDAPSGEPGNVTIDGKTILVSCGANSLAIDMLKPAGKPEMTSEAFLAGHKHLL